MVSLNDPGTVRALGGCGLLEYFILSGMRHWVSQVLLQFLIRSWDLKLHTFHIGDKFLPILVDDIYLSLAPISLAGSIHGAKTVKDNIR